MRERGLQRVTPAQRRRVPVRGQVAERELPGAVHLALVGDPLRDRLRDLVRDPGLVEVAQVADQRHRAHGGDDRLPDGRVQRAPQPAGQRLPGQTRLGEPLRTARGGHRCPSLGDRQREQLAVGAQQQVGGRRRGVLGVVAAVQCVLEQLALPRLGRIGRRVGQLQHVAEAVALGRGVVLEQRPAVVEAPGGVGDAALDRLRQVAAVAGRPVREQLARLVRALEDGGDHLAGEAGRLGVQPGPGELGGADQGCGPQPGAVAQPAEQAERPLGIGHGELADQRGVPVVAVAALLVEGVMADHVGHREQKEFGLVVAQETGAALVVDGALPGAGHR